MHGLLERQGKWNVDPQVSAAEPAEMTPAAGVLADYLTAQIDRIVAGDIGLRCGDDPIHDTRVAIRRLRSTLRVFARELDASVVKDFEGELKWFAGLLGEVRDCEVQQGRFGDALGDIPDELVLGPVKARIRTDLLAIQLPARNGVSDAMESSRYQEVVAVLGDWRAAPPVSPGISTGTLRTRARRAQRKADRRLAEALDSGDEVMLHRARKAAKRARYAAELCAPLNKPKRAKRTIKHYKAIQGLLGDHQDAVVACEALRRMAIAAGTTVAENGFTYGMLYARELQIARQCRRDVRRFR